MKNNKTFWDFLEEFRLDNNIKKNELSETLGISYTQLSELTTGKRTTKPTVQLLLLFCEKFNIDINEVLDNVDFWDNLERQ